MQTILEEVEKLDLVKQFMSYLVEFSSLVGKSYSNINVVAKHLVMKSNLPSFIKVQNELEEIFNEALKEEDNEKRVSILRKAIERSNYGFDLLLSFFNHSNNQIKRLAEEVYILKVYSSFSNKFISFNETNKMRSVTWEFSQTQLSMESINKKDYIVGN
jgi:hypothetical protein